MVLDNERWLALSDAFYSAALDPSGWHGALDGLAEATGSKSGQLIGIGADAAIPFNILTRVDPDVTRAFVAGGGGDPRINPRVNAGMNAPVLRVLAEADFITPDEHARHPHYQEFAVPWDIPYICLTTLERREGLLIGLAVLRSQSQGHISNEQREIFASLAPHVRAAVRMQLALEGEGGALLAGAMQALSLPAFVCDRTGRVRAVTPAAERLIGAERGLALRLGHLHAANPEEDKALNDAVLAAARGFGVGGSPVSQTVLIRQRSSGTPAIVLDVIALPSRQFDFGFTPRVLVVSRGERDSAQSRAIVLRAAYGLSPAETEIAIHVAHGRKAESIAELRRVSVGTVRQQIKAILAKVGVRRQAELMAIIGRM